MRRPSAVVTRAKGVQRLGRPAGDYEGIYTVDAITDARANPNKVPS